MTNFRKVLDDCLLEDIGYSGPDFTWSNCREGSNLILERLDRRVFNLEWRNLFPSFLASHLSFWGSDHRPILLEFPATDYVHARRSSRRFHYESCWEDDEECKALIKDTWYLSSGPPDLLHVCESLKNCASSLQMWYSFKRGALVCRIKANKKKTLASVGSQVHSLSWLSIRQLKKELDEDLHTEEIYWRDRSRMCWLCEGDRNTKFFHLQASCRRSTNSIKGLYDSNDIWCENPSAISHVISTYFNGIFATSNPSLIDPDSVLSLVDSRLALESHVFLDSDFTAEEIRAALFQMHLYKAPGLDGFPACFFFSRKIGVLLLVILHLLFWVI
ncbi:hypothetical protein ACOSQ4_014432 [Xanthoceras sorbifolium]